jgi:hypothetical protein
MPVALVPAPTMSSARTPLPLVHTPSVGVLVLDGKQMDAGRMAAAAEAFDVVLLVSDARAAATVLGALGDLGDIDRRTQPTVDRPAGLTVDSRRHVATWQGAVLPLSRHEREILRCLLTDPGRVWPYRDLHEQVWGNSYLGDPSLLHSALKRLRRKLRQAGVVHPIEAVRGVGFRITLS